MTNSKQGSPRLTQRCQTCGEMYAPDVKCDLCTSKQESFQGMLAELKAGCSRGKDCAICASLTLFYNRLVELRDEWQERAHDSQRRPGKRAVYGHIAAQLTELLEGSTLESRER